MNIVNITSALEKVKSGLPIIFQTDTLPAIGCLPKFSKTIYQTKKRNENKPLILMGADKKQLIEYVHESAKKDFKKIASKYWPGALTIIIPVANEKKIYLTSRNSTLGLRIPNSHLAQTLIKATGPLLTSSANISGRSGFLTPEDIANDFPSVNILGPVPWEKCSGSASTIISWDKNRKWTLLREGEIFSEEFN